MSQQDQQVTALVIGAGQRGSIYASFSLDFPQRLKIVGVADTRESKRRQTQQRYNIDKSCVFEDWQEATKIPKFADFCIIATPDRLHKDAAVAFASLGYHILLEKPMAVTEQDCKEITNACITNNVMLSVCHVLRYTPVNQKVKQLLVSGAIGEIINIEHTEPVGFFHFAHSYVRGNWRNTQESSFSLMTKSCHDIDLIRYWMGEDCTSLASFGSLKHFHAKNKPLEAKNSTRCLSCAYESQCCYSAKKIYLDPVTHMDYTDWPVSVITEETPTVQSVTQALQTGPYGRCVYECDNDVCDHQVVSMQFASGATASFTMIAYTEKLCQRQTKIYGSKGEITIVDGDVIYHFDFLTQRKQKIATIQAPPSRLVGHGGADFFLMDAFVRAVATNNKNLILTGPEDALASHLLVFRAEQARLQHQIINL